VSALKRARTKARATAPAVEVAAPAEIVPAAPRDLDVDNVPADVDQRITIILDMLANGSWQDGITIRQLTRSWGVTRDQVAYAHKCALHILRREMQGTSDLRARLKATIERTIGQAALARDAKSQRVVIDGCYRLAQLCGAVAPQVSARVSMTAADFLSMGFGEASADDS
jgi:hypothetical protein